MTGTDDPDLSGRISLRYAIRDTATGQIRAVIRTTAMSAPRNLRLGETLEELPPEVGPVDGETHYLPAGVLTDRPVLPIDIGTDGALAAGGTLELTLPDGTIVNVDGSDVGEAEGGGVALEFPDPGQYEVRIRAFPYQEHRATVIVE